MNIEPKHKDEKAHNNMKHGVDEDVFQSQLRCASAHIGQEQYHPQQKLDNTLNSENIHMASLLSNFRHNHNS